MSNADLSLDQTKNQVLRVLIFTLILNLVIALAKLIYGYFSGALSMIADGFHSAMDSTSNIVGMIAIHFAYQPPDKDHHYGHRKAEILASMGIGVLLALTCLEVFKELIERILSPQVPHISMWAFVIMVCGLVINTLVVVYESREGRKLGSQILLSDAEHTRSDILVTLSVLGSLAAIYFKLYWIDTVVSIVIILFIARISYQLLKQNMHILMDTSPIDTDKILHIVQDLDEIENCHKIRAHGTPDDIYVDLHIWVDPNMSVTKAHELAHAIKDRLKSQIQGITDVTIHVEPSD